MYDVSVWRFGWRVGWDEGQQLVELLQMKMSMLNDDDGGEGGVRVPSLGCTCWRRVRKVESDEKRRDEVEEKDGRRWKGWGKKHGDKMK